MQILLIDAPKIVLHEDSQLLRKQFEWKLPYRFH